MSATTPTGEPLDLDDLPEIWRYVALRYERVRALSEKPAGDRFTTFKFDQEHPSGRRAHIAAHRHLGVAMENHDALMSVLQHHGATPTAPWSLLRPVFESAFIACWVLDPNDAPTRRKRGLHREVLDHMEQNRYLRTFEKLPEVADAVRETISERRDGAEKTYRAEAHDLHVSYDEMKKKVNVVDELPRLRFLAQQEPLLRQTFVAQWRLLSGYEHGLSWAMLVGSDKSTKQRIPGGHEVMLTMNDAVFVTACKTAAWLLLEAMERVELLHTMHVR